MVNLQHFSRLSSLVIHLWQTWVLAPVCICTNILIRMHFLEKYTFKIPVCTLIAAAMAVSDLLYQIHLLHISHNAPYLPPRILHNLCFSFLLGTTAVQEKLKTILMQNFGGQINGRCARGVFKNTADTPTKVIGFILNDTDVI